MQYLNMDPCGRSTPGGIILMALLPPNAKSEKIHTFYTAVLDRMKFEGAFSGFDIYDAHEKQNRRYCIDLAWLLEDLKGLPNGLGCKTTGSLVGADPWTDLRGIKV
jgi:hypothetical protein